MFVFLKNHIILLLHHRNKRGGTFWDTDLGGDPNSMGGTPQKVPRGTFQDDERAPGGPFGILKGPPGDDLGY